MPDPRIHLNLYTADASSEAGQVRQYLSLVLKFLPGESYRLAVLDVSKNAALCEKQNLFCLPTLDVTVKPGSRRRFIGELKNGHWVRYLAEKFGVYEKVFAENKASFQKQAGTIVGTRPQLIPAGDTLSGSPLDRHPARPKNLRDSIVRSKRDKK